MNAFAGTCAASLIAAALLAATNDFVVSRPARDAALALERGAMREVRPALRGFRAALRLRPRENGEHVEAVAWPLEPTSDARTPQLEEASKLVAQRLARDGLLPTTLRAIEILGAASFEGTDGLEQLKRCGIPIDWLAFFDEQHDARALTQRLARELGNGASRPTLSAQLAARTLAFQPSRPGFQVATESGEHEIGMLRLQLTSGTYWQGVGDGGCVDLARQLAAALPDVAFVASIQDEHLEPFLATARAWNVPPAQRWTLLPQALPVAQWTQDDAKPGRVTGAAGASAVTLVPRYASRGEEGSVFVPGETFLIEDFAALGHDVVQSPLLFQGGDLIAVRHPKTGERILLIGEAEIHRNTALGLTRAQVAEAFRVEFGVERCIILPALSFHIDYEVCVRAVGDDLVAFVNDTPAAVEVVLRCGMKALADHGRLDAQQVTSLREKLTAGRWGEFVDDISLVMSKDVHVYGHFPEALAELFGNGSTDSGVGNLQTFLLALDMLVSHAGPLEDLPFDPHALSYLKSFVRRDAERAALFDQLAREGFKLVPVPSLAEAIRGINYINGVHDSTRYLMPAHGGLYSPLDQAARDVFQRTLGAQVKILPVLSSESQRRAGAVRCSVSVYPKL